MFPLLSNTIFVNRTTNNRVMGEARKKTKVIIVEDNRYMMKLYEEYVLKSDDAMIAGTFSNIASVKAYFENGGRADFVILDIQLHDGNGLQLIPFVKSFNDRTKIIVATTYIEFKKYREDLNIDFFLDKMGDLHKIASILNDEGERLKEKEVERKRTNLEA